MPEGHTIHRLALDHERDLGGEPLGVSSPQGRAIAAARELDGRAIAAIDAHGKHLLYRFVPAADAARAVRSRERRGRPSSHGGAPDGRREDVDAGDVLTLHVHLGLFGRFRRQRTPPQEPRGEKRLRFVGERWTVDLSGAIASRLLDPGEEDELRAKLGPDPLRGDADPEAFVAQMRRRRIPIGGALLDQSIVAGIGNVYRAEALFAERIDPATPCRELPDDAVRRLWDRMAAQLAAGVRDRRIVTVETDAATASERRRIRRREAVNVYRRRSCGVCGGPVSTGEVAARTLSWCPHCQTGP